MKTKSFAHPGCYARVLNTCSSKLSREHYVSQAVLDLLGDEHRITNARWLPHGQQSEAIPSSALGSRILCETHNNALSTLDAHAKVFFSELLWGISDSPPPEKHRRVLIDADQLELWLLKACCGAFASGNLVEHRRRVPREIPDAWVSLLFSGRGWQPATGMHIRQVTLHPYRGYAIGPAYMEDSCVGGGLQFGGVEMFLLFGGSAANRILEESSGEMRPLIYRPGQIRIESRARTIDIMLEWRTWIPTQAVSYRWTEAEPGLAPEPQKDASK